jgi:dTDP-4-dehydrorhamnose 3,5-epimerase-like enzyme
MSNLGQLIEIPTHRDERGSLSVAEIGGVLPFVVRRAYWIHGTKPGVSRGFHAHRKLNQFCVCVSGSARFLLEDAKGRQEVVLDRPDRGLFVGTGVWHEMHDLTQDCVLLVLADGEYDESDYLRNRKDMGSA